MEVVAEYQEQGVSGAKPLDERPQIVSLLEDAAAGKFQAVVWYKLDRLSRSMSKGLHLIEQLEAMGVDVHSVSEPLDASTPQGSLFRDMLLRFAQFERETIRTRVMEGRYDVAENDRWPGGQLPYGYMNDEGVIAEQPTEAAVVRRMFSMRASGMSFPDIAAALGAEGIRPRRKEDRQASKKARLIDPDAPTIWLEQRFTASSIQGYTSNTAYMGAGISKELPVSGNRGAKRKVFTFEAPALVSPDEWARANTPRPGRKAIRNAGNRVNSYGLSERILHEHSDGTRVPMFGQTRYEGIGRARRALRFYRCSASRTVDGKEASCPGFGEAYGHELSSVVADRVEALVLRWMLETLKDPERLMTYVQRADATLSAQEGAEVDVDALTEHRERLLVKRARYVESYAEQLITREDLKKRVAVVEAELEAIDGALERSRNIEALRHDLHVTIGELLAMPISENGDALEDGQRDPDRGSRQWWYYLLEESLRCLKPGKYGRTPALSEWAKGEMAHLAQLFGVEVTVKANDGSWWHPEGASPAQWPEVYPTFSPARALQSATRSQITPS